MLARFSFAAFWPRTFKMFTHKCPQELPKNNKVQNTNFNEILYADDTICMAEGKAAVQHQLAAIETFGAMYGLKLNKKKCAAIMHVQGQ